MADDDRPTLTFCTACNGQWQILRETPSGRYRTSVCPWCIHGAMTLEQVKAYSAWRKKHKK